MGDDWTGLRPEFDGLPYRDFIEQVAIRRKARSYLEIGVRDGYTLARLRCDAIGVDPRFMITADPIGLKRRLFLFRMTSDEFFRDHDARHLLGRPLELCFLDGLHHFEVLLRDFIGTERVCDGDSAIMLDDCFPADLEMADRDSALARPNGGRLAGWWTGDVWKLIPILREYRPDLRMTFLDTRPTGTVFITNLSPGSTTLSANYAEIVARYIGLRLTRSRFDTLYENDIVPSRDFVAPDPRPDLAPGPPVPGSELVEVPVSHPADR